MIRTMGLFTTPLAGALALGLLAAAPVAAVAQTAQGDDPAKAAVAPLTATVNAARLGPMPEDGRSYVIRRYDDSEAHTAVARALDAALAARGDGEAAAAPLAVEFDLYVVPSGVPVLAKGVLETSDIRRDRPARETHPGINVTALQGRTAGVEGNVLHRRQDSFRSTLRLEVMVQDPADGGYVWRGWVDTPMNGLSRAQTASLVVPPLVETLGQTVAGRAVTVTVPESMGGPAAE
ncbi:hypothetical protein [Roseospira navarrensis]|uniref:DUF4136 domain-containing protein n=1 Tax=Roseospira navarrensis TaxID=140058 RepID=A0A7X1ZGX9_9PROT|nr:hypothetical protein [Roseospira navarrensis]MQX38338.1 hypothetical protein [Roseospira navarrensis]